MELVVYRLCLVLKLVGVALFAGGMVAGLVARTRPERHFAVFRLAGLGIGLVWVAGYALSLQLQVSLLEPWILGGFLMSALSKIALARSATREVATRGDWVASVVPFVVAIVLMVFRPTWAMLK